MSSLVLELQRDAMDEHKSVVSLLQKARAVSGKLNVLTIKDWIEHELEGYPNGADVPSYREVVGQLVCANPYGGYITINVENAEVRKLFTTRRAGEPLPALLDLISSDCSSRKILMSYLPEQADIITSMMANPQEPFLSVEFSVIRRIIASVRTRILDFAIDLETQGILGEGMAFSNDEKERASHISYTLNIENMTGSQIQQGTTSSTQSYSQSLDIAGLSSFTEKLLASVGDISSSVDREQIRSDLETVQSQLRAPNPRIGIVRECLLSVKTILEGAAGSIVSTMYLPFLPSLLASLPS